MEELMNRPARVGLMVLALAKVLVFTAACKGGGTLDGLDGGTDEAMGFASAKGAACEKSMVTIDDSAADSPATAGGPACANDNECTVRMAGDYCSCPNTPRPMLVSNLAAFDESLNGITGKCTCEILPCAPAQHAKSVCREGRCALADGAN
jgi:hypothetical protein